MKTSQLAQKLFRTIFQSVTADDYCKHLVHSVLNDTTVRGAGLFVLTADSNLKAVGHYGMAEDLHTLEYANVWDSNPLSLAVKQGRLIVAPPSLAVRSSPKALETRAVRNYGSVCTPVRVADLVAGGLQVIFDGETPEDLVQVGIFELLALAAEPYLGLPSSAAFAPVVGSQWHGFPKTNVHTVSSLSTRQLAILGEMAQGLTYYQISRNLLISESTVKQEAGRAFRYFGVNTRQDAVHLAKEQGLIPQ